MKETRISLLRFIEEVRKPPKTQSVEERIRHFASIYARFKKSEAKVQSERCIDCGNPYCHWGCPVHNHIPQWLQLVAEGNFFAAAELAHQTNSLPEMCGMVCPQESLCEGACTLNDGLGAVTIGAIEHYLTDTAFRRGWKPDLSAVQALPFQVAVVGSGPAGIACADRLTRMGIHCNVYDRHPEIGGLLTFGIPEFKLEKQLVRRRRSILEGMGIQFHTGIEIGRDITAAELLETHDALFLGLGADEGIRARVPGEHLKGVFAALPFLIGQIHNLLGLSSTPELNFQGKKIIVLGAGDTAMDCTRTAIRLGASSVHCLYRRREEDLHNSQKDYNHAREEGVQFHWQRLATEFCGTETLEAIRVHKTDFDRHGKLIITEKQEIIEADVVIVAYGFNAAKFPWLESINVERNPKGLIQTGVNLPMQTSNPDVFAGGDIVLGANLVVNAVAQGQQAAQSIYAYLQNK